MPEKSAAKSGSKSKTAKRKFSVLPQRQALCPPRGKNPQNLCINSYLLAKSRILNYQGFRGILFYGKNEFKNICLQLCFLFVHDFERKQGVFQCSQTL